MTPLLESISLEPSPAIEACKSGIDRTLLRENLRLTPNERVEKMMVPCEGHPVPTSGACS